MAELLGVGAGVEEAVGEIGSRDWLQYRVWIEVIVLVMLTVFDKLGDFEIDFERVCVLLLLGARETDLDGFCEFRDFDTDLDLD